MPIEITTMPSATRAGIRKALRIPPENRALQIGRYEGQFGEVFMDTPPAVTLSAANAASTIASPLSIPAVVDGAPSARFAYWSGEVDLAGASFPADAGLKNTALHVPNGNTYPLYEFFHFGRYVDLQILGQGAPAQVYINDEATVADVADIQPPADGNFYRIVIDFGSIGFRKIGFRTGNWFFGATVSITDTLTATSKAGVGRMVAIGDSFTEGTGAEVEYLGFPGLLRIPLGLDIWISGSGGTGYLNEGPFGRVNFRGRIEEDCLQYNPDYVMIAGGINDGSYPVADIVAEAELLYDQILAALPGVTLIVISPFWPHGPPPSNITDLAAALKDPVESRGGIYIDFIAPPLVTGTGNAGAPTGDGNADYITSADNTHPTPLGHEVYASCIYQKLASLI